MTTYYNDDNGGSEDEQEVISPPSAQPPAQSPSNEGCWKKAVTYGILGPNAIRFQCFKKTSVLHRESFNTKLMYLIFLGITTVFACFFIIPYPNVNTSRIWPCVNQQTGKQFNFDGFWGDCRGHAGYFLVYRVFLAVICLFSLIFLLLIRVRNSKDCRAGIHQGYWLWKLVLFVVLTTTFIFVITLDNNALFDEVFMFCGLTASFLFAFPTLIFILDVCEMVVIRLKAHMKRWKIFYWFLTATVFMLDLVGLAFMILFYSTRTPAVYPDFVNADVAGDSGGKTCPVNVVIITYVIGVGIFLMFVSTARELIPHEKYLNTGFLQAAIMFGHTILSVYLALGNSTETSCRPVWYAFSYNANQLDVAFTTEGFIHALLTWLTLGYFTLCRGPRTDSAPLSRFWLLMCCSLEKVPESTATNEVERILGGPVRKSRVSAISNIEDVSLTNKTEVAAGPSSTGSKLATSPIGSPPPGLQPAGNLGNVPKIVPPSKGLQPGNADVVSNATQIGTTVSLWGAPPPRPENEDPFLDESEQCNYSWSLFHLFLTLGALSMMMGLTNFIRPRADGPLAANLPAFLIRLLISPIAMIAFTSSIFVKIPIRWNWRKIKSEAEMEEGPGTQENATEEGKQIKEKPDKDISGSIQSPSSNFMNRKSKISISDNPGDQAV